MNFQFLLIVSMSSIVLVSLLLFYFIYSMVLMDAKSRGIQQPKFWAVLASSSGRGEGLFVYLFHRKKYSKNMGQADREKMKKIKQKIYTLLLVDLVSFIFAVIALMNLPM